MKKTFYFMLLIAFTVVAGFASCSSDDDDGVTVKDISVNFVSSEIGIDEDATSADITINLSRTADYDIHVTVSQNSSDVVYGTDYTTSPAETNGSVVVKIPAGSASASLTISKVDGIFFEGTEKVKFTITSLSVAEGVVIGTKNEATLTFGAILSEGNTMTLEGKSGDENYANSVFVDFSSNTQTGVARKSWNLGFYCGNEFRVFLNPAMQMAAAATTKTNISEVTVADAEGIPTLVPVMMSGIMIGVDNVDDFAGDITKTAFAEVSATDADNKVYIVAMEGHTTTENFYKVKVSRSGSGYKIEYGLLGGTTTSSVEVSKNDAYNMVGVSFENKKTVNVEPKAKTWDIEWTYATGPTTSNGETVAYFMQDYVYINNLAGTQAAEVLTSTVSYENFDASSLSSATFSSDRNIIGSNWRVLGGMGGGATGILDDRFYVVKDPNGNYYKMRFTKIGVSDDGERGRPILEYALVD